MWSSRYLVRIDSNKKQLHQFRIGVVAFSIKEIQMGVLHIFSILRFSSLSFQFYPKK